MSAESTGEQNNSDIARAENHERTSVLQEASLVWWDALDREDTEGGYLQRFVYETPVASVAFRMDSKREYGLPDGKRVHQGLYVYVPESTSPRSLIDLMWVKHVDQYGAETRSEISARSGWRPWPLPVERSKVDEVEAAKAAEATVESILEIGELQRKAAIGGLRRLVHALRDDFKLVPFRS